MSFSSSSLRSIKEELACMGTVSNEYRDFVLLTNSYRHRHQRKRKKKKKRERGRMASNPDIYYNFLFRTLIG
jgi:hypothetical protein